MTIRSTAAGTARRAVHMIARGRLKKAHDNSKLQEVDVDLLYGEAKNRIEHWHPYGITTVPKEGAEALVLFPGGNRSHGIVIAIADRKYRLTGMETGDVAIHDDSDQSVKLTRKGIVISSPKEITINSTTKISLSAPELNLNANAVQINGESLKHNEKNIGSTHTHGGIKSGPSSTDVPNK